MNIAIIPARGGSKRIPRKNLKDFCGKPMLAYAISAAKKSGLFEHIVVSTDDEEIAQVANVWGAETPFVRPNNLADDFTPTVPVIANAIETCRGLGWKFDWAFCIYPGVPFIQIDDIQGALERLKNSDADYCFPVTEYPTSIQRALKVMSNGAVMPFNAENELTRTQDLEPAYYDAGQFYCGRVDAWLNNPRIHSNGLGYVIPNWRVVDIDTDSDWRRAELMYAAVLDGQ